MPQATIAMMWLASNHVALSLLKKCFDVISVEARDQNTKRLFVCLFIELTHFSRFYFSIYVMPLLWFHFVKTCKVLSVLTRHVINLNCENSCDEFVYFLFLQ